MSNTKKYLIAEVNELYFERQLLGKRYVIYVGDYIGKARDGDISYARYRYDVDISVCKEFDTFLDRKRSIKIVKSGDIQCRLSNNKYLAGKDNMFISISSVKDLKNAICEISWDYERQVQVRDQIQDIWYDLTKSLASCEIQWSNVKYESKATLRVFFDDVVCSKDNLRQVFHGSVKAVEDYHLSCYEGVYFNVEWVNTSAKVEIKFIYD